jgi:hypothetical protein
MAETAPASDSGWVTTPGTSIEVRNYGQHGVVFRRESESDMRTWALIPAAEWDAFIRAAKAGKYDTR